MTLAHAAYRPESPRASRRVLLAAGDARFRVLARALLAQQPGVTVVAEAATAVEAQQAARLLQPDLVLVDLELPGEPLPRLIRFLHALTRPPAVVVMAWDDGDEYRQAALRAGATCCVSRREFDTLFREMDGAQEIGYE
jgi:DNA-binding NarL/FixJ family response regulator